jgi:hypothetical protein
MRWLIASLVGAAVLVLSAVVGPAAGAAGTVCPSGGIPAPGSTITGGLEVVDACVLTDVTIKGGVTIDPLPADFSRFPALGLRSGRVTGGIAVNGGTLALGFDPDTGELTHGQITVDGGITLNGPFFTLVAGATINGGVTMNKGYDSSHVCGGDPFCWLSGALCGNEIHGNVTVRDNNTVHFFVGDPKEPFFPNGDCAGNTIHGSVTFSDSRFTRPTDGEPSEIEGNTVTGSVSLDNSIAEVNENTIGGSFLCMNGSEVHPPAPPDLGGNAVRGKNTCE